MNICKQTQPEISRVSKNVCKCTELSCAEFRFRCICELNVTHLWEIHPEAVCFTCNTDTSKCLPVCVNVISGDVVISFLDNVVNCYRICSNTKKMSWDLMHRIKPKICVGISVPTVAA